jgi:hypothetical protein
VNASIFNAALQEVNIHSWGITEENLIRGQFIEERAELKTNKVC